MGVLIKDYPRYEIFKDGTVFSHITKKFLKPSDINGYESVELFNEYGSRRILIHRLVAQAFIPNPNNWPQVNHKDENKKNNNVNNLEWCTAKYNMNYNDGVKRRTAKRDYTNPVFAQNARINGAKRSKPVIQINKSGCFVNSFSSGAEASRCTGINQAHLLECCAGKRKTAGGFIWKYHKERGEDLSQSQF